VTGRETRASVERFDKFDDRDAALVRWRFGRGYVSDLARERYRRMFHGGRRVLDVGCGVGAAARWAEGAAYVGIDLSVALVAQGRAGEGLALAAADVTRLPFADNSFDRVLCMGVLHHLSAGEVDAALGEMARVLAPGGEVALVEPNPWNPWNRLMAYVRPAERGILHTGRRPFQRRFEAAPGLQIAAFDYEHTVVLLAHLTFFLRRWAWVTGPRFTRALRALHRLLLCVTPRAIRTHTFWRLRKRGTGADEGPGARPAAGPAA